MKEGTAPTVFTSLKTHVMALVKHIEGQRLGDCGSKHDMQP